MKLQLCICSCLLLLGSARAGRGRLSIEPSSGIVYLNKDQVFNCKVEGSDAEDFHWIFPDGTVIEEDANERFQLRQSEYDQQLHIMNAKASDSGVYTCKAEDDNGDEMRKTISINVIQKVTFQNVKSELEFDEGSQAVLGCDVTGIPQPIVSWTRDGQDVPLSVNGRFQKLQNNHLQISSIEPSDAGMYECVGKIMERNEQDSTTIAVTVNYAPQLLPPPTEPVRTWLGNPVNVSCRLRSFPRATVAWTHNGADLGEPVNVFPAGEREEMTSTLEVTVTSEADLGEYRCTASNSLGRVSGLIWVKQGDLPSAPQNLTAVPHSTTVQVSVARPVSDGGIPILGYQLEWRNSEATEWLNKTAESENSWLVGLEPYTLYLFRAAALNGRGLGEYSLPITARTLSIREPDRPKLKAQNDSEGNTYHIYFADPESGGSPVLKHNIKYKEEQSVEWISDSVNGTDSYLLKNLTWATLYVVQVEAENQMGPSQPTFLNFTTPEQPLPPVLANLATGEKAKIGMGGIVGIIMMIFLVLLVAVDVTCYYTRRCGILMCIAVNVLGKQEPAAKRLDQEMGVTVISAEPKGNLCEIHTGGTLQKYSKTKHSGISNDKMPLTKSETLPMSDKAPNQP